MYHGFWPACGSLFTYGRFNYGGLIMMIIGVVILAVIIYLAVKKGNLSTGSGTAESPLDALQKRYVNGEINKEEYLEKKIILEGK